MIEYSLVLKYKVFIKNMVKCLYLLVTSIMFSWQIIKGEQQVGIDFISDYQIIRTKVNSFHFDITELLLLVIVSLVGSGSGISV